MNKTARTILIGSLVGGAAMQLALSLACGSVSSMPRDARAADGTTVDNNTVDTNAAATTFAGFSYHTNAVIKPAQWNPFVVDVLDFNTFGSGSFNVTTGTFTAPMAGYYRFNAHGWSSTPRPANTTDQRMAIGLVVNGTRVAISGGQLSEVDSPLPGLHHIRLLAAGDTVSLASFTTVQTTFGGPNEHAFYFQGEFLGP